MKLKRHHRARAGFTLIELLVVISIIAILSSTILASLSTAKLKAKDASTLEEAHQVQTALELYNIDHGGYPRPATTNYYCVGASTCTSPSNGTTISGYVLTLNYGQHKVPSTAIANAIASMFSTPAYAETLNTGLFAQFASQTNSVEYVCTNISGSTCPPGYAWIVYPTVAGGTTWHAITAGNATGGYAPF